MTIREVTKNRRDYLPLLLLADEQEDMINRYLDRGTMFVLDEDGTVVGECVVTDEGEGVLEIQSLAVDPGFQRAGRGRTLLDFVGEKYRGAYRTLLVGTGDSPLTVPFYERCGFVRHHIVKNYFLDHYDHPIFECGKRLTDKVYLSRAL